MKVGEIMSAGAATVTPDAPLTEAARLMVDHRISGLPVVDERGSLVGIVTERDFMVERDGRRGRLLDVLMGGEGAAAGAFTAAKVAEVMTPEPVAIDVEAPVQEAVELMNRHNVKRLPVTREGKVVGVVSRSNLIVAVLRRF